MLKPSWAGRYVNVCVCSPARRVVFKGQTESSKLLESSSYLKFRIVCPANPEGEGGSCRGCAAKSCVLRGPPGQA